MKGVNRCDGCAIFVLSVIFAAVPSGLALIFLSYFQAAILFIAIAVLVAAFFTWLVLTNN